MKHWCAGFGDNKNFTCIIYPDEPPKLYRYSYDDYEIMTMCGRVLHYPWIEYTEPSCPVCKAQKAVKKYDDGRS